MAYKKTSRALLEVDESILTNNLKFGIKSDDADFLESLFPTGIEEKAENPAKLVVPIAGFCIKTTTCGREKKKIFINVCITNAIPGPKDITTEELKKIWLSDELQEFRVPLSIGNLREEPDKQGEPCHVYDIAINPDFFKKVEADLTLRSFLIHVIFEALENKYQENISVSNGYVILKNRKAMGSIKPQHIEIRNSQQELVKVTEVQNSKQELVKVTEIQSSKQELIKVMDISHEKRAYRLRIVPNNKGEVLVGDFHIPKVVKSDVKLRLGEDRICVKAPLVNYSVDLCIPCLIDCNSAVATLDCAMEMLTVTASVVSSH